MANFRLKKMPKAVHRGLETPVTQAPIVEENKWDNTQHELEKAELEDQKSLVNASLKTIQEAEESFEHQGAVEEKDSVEERVSKLPTIEAMEKSIHQETFESHVNDLQNSIGRKGLRESNNIILDSQLDSINQKLASLSPARDSTPAPVIQISKKNDPKHQDWRDDVAQDFENLFKQTSTSKEKREHSFFSFFTRFFKKSGEEHFVAMHKEDAEKKAVDLVIKISKRIEGDQPIPVKELDWIEANLMNLHKEIWNKD